MRKDILTYTKDGQGERLHLFIFQMRAHRSGGNHGDRKEGLQARTEALKVEVRPLYGEWHSVRTRRKFWVVEVMTY